MSASSSACSIIERRLSSCVACAADFQHVPARCAIERNDSSLACTEPADYHKVRLWYPSFWRNMGDAGIRISAVRQARTASPASMSRSSSGSSTCSPDARWPFVGVALPEAAAPPLARRPVWRTRKWAQQQTSHRSQSKDVQASYEYPCQPPMMTFQVDVQPESYPHGEKQPGVLDHRRAARANAGLDALQGALAKRKQTSFRIFLACFFVMPGT